MGYVLTGEGEREFDTYSDADEDELRLTRRARLFPVLEEVKGSPNSSFDELLSLVEDKDVSRQELIGILGNLLKKGLVVRVEPSGSASGDEWRKWRWYLTNQEHPRYAGKKPEDARRQFERMKERYPEAYQADLDEYWEELKDLWGKEATPERLERRRQFVRDYDAKMRAQGYKRQRVEGRFKYVKGGLGDV